MNHECQLACHWKVFFLYQCPHWCSIKGHGFHFLIWPFSSLWVTKFSIPIIHLRHCLTLIFVLYDDVQMGQ